MTIEDINQTYQEYQDELAVRELHLKLLPSFNTEQVDDLINLLKEVKETTPIFTPKSSSE